MAKEYIERDVVLEVCKRMAAEPWNKVASPESWADAYETFADDVNDLDAADVTPVVHGHWVRNKVVYRTPLAHNFHCSVCGESAHTTKFCPNCGAKMDGGAGG